MTLWTVAGQPPLSMGFSRQEYWSGFPFPSPGDLPNLGIKPESPELQVDSIPSEPPGKTPCIYIICPLFWISIPFSIETTQFECLKNAGFPGGSDD